MPIVDIDYSNTIFYKIYCKDESVSDIYVGHTTNFVQRKYCHKRTCHREKDPNYNLKVYKCIREHGGWNNWKMDIIGFHECYDHYEARKIEQTYFESLKATLNSIEPLPKPKPKPKPIPKPNTEKRIWHCDLCGTTCPTEKTLQKHLLTKKHISRKQQMTTTLVPKSSAKYFCEHCDYSTRNLNDFKKHLLTRKHQLATNATEKIPKNTEYVCDCGKKYKDRTGLWRHKRKCTYITQQPEVKETAKIFTEADVEVLFKRMLTTIKEELRKAIPTS